MIAGEYAITEPDEKALVMAIDRYIKVTLSDCRVKHGQDIKGEKHFVEALGHKLPWSIVDGRVDGLELISEFDHLVKTINKTFEYVRSRGKEPEVFSLVVESQLHEQKTGKKLGFGSSAALVVALTKGILRWMEVEIDQEELFRLTLRTHADLQSKGSGADIAAAVFGGFFAYKNMSDEFLHLTHVPERNEFIWSLTMPKEIEMLVGWTGYPASTKEFLNKFHGYRRGCPEDYFIWLMKSRVNMNKLIEAFFDHDVKGILKGIRRNQELLTDLDFKASLGIVTSRLKALVDIGNHIEERKGRPIDAGLRNSFIYSGAKISGSGGGDCGICLINKGAFSTNKVFKAELKNLEIQWKIHGIVKTETCIDSTKYLDIFS